MPTSKPILLLPIQLRRYIVGLAAFWTVAVAITLSWEIWDEINHAKAIAGGVGRAILSKELAFHRWNAKEGGVYLPVSEKVRPDPVLADIAERDISTPSGRQLTLIRPSMMMSELEKTAADDTAYKIHLSNLNPSRPDTEPDLWEKKSLDAFAKGITEESSLDEIGGETYLRLMRPIFFDKTIPQNAASKPHLPGELIGGLCVSVPMNTVWPMERSEILRRLMGYGGMWILGLGGIFISSRQLQSQIRRRQTAEDELRAAHLVLEQRVAERTQQLAGANLELQKEIADRVQAEKWLLESEARFRGYFELGLVGMAILSSDKQWTEVNPHLCKMLHYSEDELLQTDWFKLSHADDRPAEEAIFDRLVEGIQGGYSLEKRFLARNGQTIWAKVSMKCLRQENVEIDSIIALVNQIDRQA